MGNIERPVSSSAALRTAMKAITRNTHPHVHASAIADSEPTELVTAAALKRNEMLICTDKQGHQFLDLTD
jgi:hypothetical protein